MALFLAIKTLTLTHNYCYRDTYPVSDEESRRHRVFYLESTHRRSAALVLLAIFLSLGALLTFILLFTFVSQAKDAKLSPTSRTFKVRVSLAFLPLGVCLLVYAVAIVEYFVYGQMYSKTCQERQDRELRDRAVELDMLDAADFVVIPSNNNKGKTPTPRLTTPVPEE